jgi:hypothetical protein
MRFARWVFLIAGGSGLLIVLPLYFLEAQIGRDQPPPITHPEYYYGFAGVVAAWQVTFLVIGSDPVRYRLAMLPAILEKASYVIAVAVLAAQGRVPQPIIGAAAMDATLGVLFIVAFFKTPKSDTPAASGSAL